MNNSGGWADLQLEEAFGSSSVLWYHDLVNAPSVAWHGFSSDAGAVHNHTHALAIFSVPQFITCNLAVLPFPITQNLSSNLSTHTFWHIVYFTWTIFSLYSISPFRQYLVSVASHTSSFCHYFDLTSQHVVCNGIIWLWHCASWYCFKRWILAWSLERT